MTRKTAFSEPLTATLSQRVAALAARTSIASLVGLWFAHTLQERYDLSLEDGLSYISIAVGAGLALLWQAYAHYRKLTGMMRHIVAQWHASQHATAPPLASLRGRSLSLLLTELLRMSEQAIETHRLHMHLRMQLSASQHALVHYQSLTGLHGDMQFLFSRIADYMQMLEDTIARRASISCLHEAFDELSEQSFNLQLFIATFERLQQPTNSNRYHEITDPTHVISRVLAPLASALDRRAMQLSSVAWNERVRAKITSTDMELLIWLMLLGTVRYAEQESTLILSCEPAADGQHTIITCLVSELAPAAMSPHERADFMREKQKYQSAHMFAHTLATSTNLMLARRLAEHAHGTLDVHARSQTSCLVELVLPC